MAAAALHLLQTPVTEVLLGAMVVGVPTGRHRPLMEATGGPMDLLECMGEFTGGHQHMARGHQQHTAERGVMAGNTGLQRVTELHLQLRVPMGRRAMQGTTTASSMGHSSTALGSNMAWRPLHLRISHPSLQGWRRPRHQCLRPRVPPGLPPLHCLLPQLKPWSAT